MARDKELAPHQVELRKLWRDLAGKSIESGVDWPYVARRLFDDIDRLTLQLETSSQEAERLQRMVSDLGFCPKDGEAMPCFTCGAGL